MKHYEFMFILRTDLDEETKTATLARIKEVIEKNGFSVLKEENRGVQKLAYEINKQVSGNYFLYYLDTESTTAIKTASVTLNILPGMLRYIFIKKEKHEIEKEA
ncbi:MAG: 30S ribosomal protein S6 [Candidatus Muiribacteriota bacterium]|jgi:small subunit ribosomal protein S6